MKFYKTIRFRLTARYLAVFMILLLIFNIIAYSMLSNHLYQNLDDNLKTRMGEIQDCIKPVEGGYTFDEKTSELVLIFDSSGMLVQSLGPNVQYANIGSLITHTLYGQSTFTNAKAPEGHELRFYSAPLALNPNNRIAIVLGKSTSDVKDLLNTFVTILGTSSLVIVMLGGVGGLYLARRALKPVEGITNTAQKISETDLSQRIHVNTDDELGHLAATFNGMVARLEAAFHRQRHFTADASHELRTPLSVIQAESSLALEKKRTPAEYRQSLELVSQEATYISGVIDELLFLARSDSGKENFTKAPVNLKELIGDLSIQMETLARSKNIKFEMGHMEDLTISGDKLKIRRVLFNLLENAIKYTPEKGKISISAESQDHSAVVSVRDTGIGIPRENLPFIFERFYRVDKSRSRAEGGSGLGLAIAKYIVEAHGGKIEVESVVEKGSIFHIFLPFSKPNENSQNLESEFKPI